VRAWLPIPRAASTPLVMAPTDAGDHPVAPRWLGAVSGSGTTPSHTQNDVHTIQVTPGGVIRGAPETSPSSAWDQPRTWWPRLPARSRSPHASGEAERCSPGSEPRRAAAGRTLRRRHPRTLRFPRGISPWRGEHDVPRAVTRRDGDGHGAGGEWETGQRSGGRRHRQMGLVQPFWGFLGIFFFQ